MQTFRISAVLLVVGVGILVYARWGRSGQVSPVTPRAEIQPVRVAALTTLRPVSEIEIHYNAPDLPPGPGYEQFATQCVICHSTRYVLNQPIFPRKTWTTEVHKMVKAYGASITPTDEKEIVNYLVAWHGREDAPAPPAQNSSSKEK